MLNYLKDGNLQIDNNLVENAIRPLALGRKKYLFAGSHDVAKIIAMYYSFFATCKENNIQPQKLLIYVLENINQTELINLHSLKYFHTFIYICIIYKNKMSIEVSHLTKYYGNQAAVNDISFSIKKGEIVAFLGPNGAGKSSTMKMITGYIPATSGEIKVCGLTVDVDNLETRKLIGYLPENNPLYLDMYVREYLEFVGRIYKIKNLKSRIDEMIEQLGLSVEQNKLIGQLSKGYRQRVGLAQAIIHNPEVLILDEPTSGLDPNQLVEIRELIRRIGKEKTVMLSTHILQEVNAICDRVIIIKNGNIVADDFTENLQKEQQFQVVFVEFEQVVSKSLLNKIEMVSKIESINEKSWLIQSNTEKDMRKIISQFANENDLLILTIRNEEKKLEEVFKELTK